MREVVHITSAIVHALPQRQEEVRARLAALPGVTEQGRRAAKTRPVALAEGKTCIDCHKGIAHQLPPIEQEIGAPKPVSATSK